jgi:hypothetical protein
MSPISLLARADEVIEQPAWTRGSIWAARPVSKT